MISSYDEYSTLKRIVVGDAAVYHMDKHQVLGEILESQYTVTL